MAKKAAKNKRKNEKRKEEKKAKAEEAEAKKAAGIEAPPSSPSSSESESDSPVKATSARMAKVGMGNAKRVLYNLEDELKAMSEEEHAKFGDSVFKALKAKTVKTPSSQLF